MSKKYILRTGTPASGVDQGEKEKERQAIFEALKDEIWGEIDLAIKSCGLSAAARKALELDKAFEHYAQASVKVSSLCDLYALRRVALEELRQREITYAKLLARAENARNILRSGVWVGGVKVRGVPKEHPLWGQYDDMLSLIANYEREALLVVDLRIDQMRSEIKSEGLEAIAMEIEQARRLYRKSRNQQTGNVEKGETNES